MLQILEQRSAWEPLRSFLYELLAVLSPDLAAVLPVTNVIFPATMAKDRWVSLFPMAVAATSAGWASDLHCLRKTQPWFARRLWSWDGWGWDLACCLRRQRASALGRCLLFAAAFWGISASMLGQLPNACGTASSWQVDRPTKLQVIWLDGSRLGNGFGRGQDGTVLWAFIITALIALLGSLSWIFIVGALRQVDWSARLPRRKQIRAGL
jgi:hypothetical protein